METGTQILSADERSYSLCVHIHQEGLIVFDYEGVHFSIHLCINKRNVVRYAKLFVPHSLHRGWATAEYTCNMHIK